MILEVNTASCASQTAHLFPFPPTSDLSGSPGHPPPPWAKKNPSPSSLMFLSLLLSHSYPFLFLAIDRFCTGAGLPWCRLGERVLCLRFGNEIEREEKQVENVNGVIEIPTYSNKGWEGYKEVCDTYSALQRKQLWIFFRILLLLQLLKPLAARKSLKAFTALSMIVTRNVNVTNFIESQR